MPLTPQPEPWIIQAMFAAIGMIGFGIPSGSELLVLLILGVMLFGRRLPEVAGKLGRAAGRVRRSFDDFKREMAAEEGLKDVAAGARKVQQVAQAPRQLADPKRLFDDLTDESQADPAQQGERQAD